MSSGFPGGHPDYFNINTATTTATAAGRSISIMNLNNHHPQNSYRSPLAGILSDPSSQIGIRRPDFIGKRSLAEFQHQHQHQQQLQQQAAFFLRNVKPRPYMDFSNSAEVSSVSNISNISSSPSFSSVPRYGVPVLQQVRPAATQPFVMGNYNNYNNRGGLSSRVSLPNINLLGAKQATTANQETEGKMMKRLQELEKQLLLDDEDGENDVSGVTNSEWSETIQNILGSGSGSGSSSMPVNKPENTVSPSPTSSSSSSCASSSASPATAVCPKQLLSEAASAIADGKAEAAAEILTRVSQVANAFGTPEQRLSFHMAAALRSRMNASSVTAAAVTDLYGKEHILSTQLLYDKSPCFKLAFMAANYTILEHGQPEKVLHVVDFDIGQGVQYVYLLHEIAAARKADKETPVELKLTTFADFGNGGVERLKLVGEGLKSLATKLGVCFSFNVSNLKLSQISPSGLMTDGAREILVVNLAFKLYKLPDESVTTENLRDEVLRRVKGLSPSLVTVVEQELNGNTASFEVRVREARGYYGALLESLDATMGRENPERVKVEEGLSRKMVNSVACEGRDRVERCEVFGKWRARMRMAGFEPTGLSQLRAESLLLKLNSGTRGNPGFTVKEEAGGISLGWMGRTLTVASAWH